MDPEHWL
jgi:hypothetical protein